MSLSINTNKSSMVALETLNTTQSDLAKTENAVSTGKKVANASDNPAAFGISSQIGGDISGQNAVNDGLSYASQIVSSTNSAANSIIKILQDVQNAVTSVGNNFGNETSLGQLNKEITGYMKSIDTIARNATTKGINLLSGGTLSGTTDGLGITSNSLTFVTGLQGDTQTLTSYGSMIGATTGFGVGHILTEMLGLTPGSATPGVDPDVNSFLTATANGARISDTYAGDPKQGFIKMISQTQKAIEAMTNVTSDLGSTQKLIDSMSDYGQKSADSLTAASGALTDADMSAESAKLTSLQTKQSLGIKSLSIANGQSQNILSLFQ
ncbi:flagellin [Bombella saccharophila]|uniref:Flagellin n=1 Tax=Bombella saccharophila TaxID=2967338 RepID=A0ABT3W773_9PROT|nr:flagellin [Bombella saccharophila]MCX5614922.1 flagellin [Bombella saccharophila]PHI96368.1 flagellin C [Parasaccharibacter apium]